MTKQRLDEIINYYKMSHEFLQEVLKSAPDSAKQNDIEKVNQTLLLFKDTYTILTEYSEKNQEKES